MHTVVFSLSLCGRTYGPWIAPDRMFNTLFQGQVLELGSILVLSEEHWALEEPNTEL